MKHTTTEAHTAKAKPQRSLAYVTEEGKAGIVTDDLVMVAMVGSEEKRQWTFDNLWFNIPLDKIADTPWMQAKYLLLHAEGERMAGNLCKIVRTKHDVWTKESLWHHEKCTDYPDEPNHPSYFMIRIHKPSDIELELQGVRFDVRNIPVFYWGNPRMPFFLVKLKDLIRETT